MRTSPGQVAGAPQHTAGQVEAPAASDVTGTDTQQVRQLADTGDHPADVPHAHGDELDEGTGPCVSRHSVEALVEEVTSDLTTLLDQELALAKLELRNEAEKAGKTAGAYGSAVVAGCFLLLFASLTLMFALADLFDSDVRAALVLTVLWAIAAVGLYGTAGKTAARLHPKPDVTVQTLQEDGQWVGARHG